MHRLAALLTLTAAFAPAAVMGALPLVAPVVMALLAVMLLLTGQEPAVVPVDSGVTERVGEPVR